MKKFFILFLAIFLLTIQTFYAQTVELTVSADYPELPEKLSNSEISLTNGEIIKLSDYKNGVVVLTFVADWAQPARNTLSLLKKVYEENPSNIRIIAVSSETEKNEKKRFRKFVKKMKLKFQTGWANKDFTSDSMEISKFAGVPQTFVIKNGRLRGVFLGSGQKVNEKLVEVIRNISKE